MVRVLLLVNGVGKCAMGYLDAYSLLLPLEDSQILYFV